MKYNREKAIQRATEVFWEQGYQGTKMRDLQERMDMRPGSIYAGFGNKETLFKDVLNYYVESSLNKIAKSVEQVLDPLDGLKQFIENELLIDEEVSNSRICLLVKTMSELDSNNDVLTTCANQGMAAIETGFASVLEQAKSEGILSDTANCQRLAKWLQMQIIGLRIYAKNQTSKGDVQRMIDDIFTSIKLH